MKLTDGIYFTLTVVLFLLSLLAVFRAPSNFLWKASVAITEWGHILALLFIALLFIPYKNEVLSKASHIFSIAGIILALSPLARAVMVTDELPDALNRQLGRVWLDQYNGVANRTKPLSLFDLFKGVSTPKVNITVLNFYNSNNIKLDLDLYRPAAQHEKLPCVIVIHGGAWNGGDSKQLAPLNNYLAARGYVVAALNYRLAPAHKFPAPVEDIKAAINYIKANADKLLIDAGNIVLLGRSAGGQIALSAAYTLNDPVIKGVISFYAPADMVWGYSVPGNPRILDSRKVLRDYIGGSYDEVPDHFKRSSPVEFVSPSSPPTLLIHGIRDEMVAYEHGIRLRKKLEQNKIKHFLLTLPWATHGADFNFNGPTGQLSTYTIERFLAAVTKQ